MTGKHLALLGGPFGAGPAGDPNWQNVSLLSATGTTNAAQNNTFLDSSTNNFTITRNGNTTQGTFTPFSQAAGYWSNYFDGSGDYLSLASNAAFALPGEYTIEFWYYPNVLSGETPFIWGTTSGAIALYANTNSELVLARNGANEITSTGVLKVGQWHHIVYCRNSSNVSSIYLNGTRVGTATVSTSYATSVLDIGLKPSSTYANGYFSNLRIVKGTDVYGASNSTITVPTSPLTAITNTSLLTCQSNRFVDNSTNAFAITVNGNTSVQAFQPFGAPTSSYSTTNVGGSGYFDGSGDYLSVADAAALDLGTGDFTIEGWVYMDSGITDNAGIITKRPSGSFSTGDWRISYRTATKKISFASDVTNERSTPAVNVNGWVHFAFVRSGTTINCYANGARGDSVTDAVNLDNVNPVEIGRNSPGVDYKGYISGIRITKGGALYSGTTYTVPTAPFTTTVSSGSVSLLCNYTNAGIYDNAAKNDMETVGNAQVSTSVYKYGTSSAYFDGTGDWLALPGSCNAMIGTGEYTVEGWIYKDSSATGERGIISSFDASTYGFGIWSDSTTLYFEERQSAYDGLNPRITVGFTTTNTWVHVAMSRQGGVLKAFVNGSQVGSTSTNLRTLSSAAVLYIGRNLAATNPWLGYLSEFRVTVGLGRYPYNFTPPAAALPTFYQAQTLTADPYFEYTTLLLPGSGTNGAQNNTFLDSSTNAFSITRNGNTTQGTFSPFSQTGWSNYFDGTGDVIYATETSSQFTYGTGDYTYECWIYPTSDASTQRTIFGRTNTGNVAVPYIYLVTTTGVVSVYYSSTIVSGTTAIPSNTWTHIMVSRLSGTTRIFVNGTQEGSASDSTNLTSPTAVMIGGSGTASANPFTGYISNARILKGTGYSSITVPTTPLTAITNTQLLTCQSNRFIDNSSNAFALTIGGNPSVQAFSPFNPTAAWSATTNGGSGYFDGTGDYLSTSTSQIIPATGDFTLEAWVYPTSISSYPTIFNQGTSGTTGRCRLYIDTSAVVTLQVSGSTVSSTATVKLNQWNYIAATRSGSSVSIYVNGAAAATGTLSDSIENTTLKISNDWESPTYGVLTGYISAARISTSIRSSLTTVPTAPFADDANTKLLLNFTNAGIYDATAKNDLETVGNAQISTTQSKFGGSSMYFDGTGDGLVIAANPEAVFGTGDFTIEWWQYWNSLTGYQTIYSNNYISANNLLIQTGNGDGKYRIFMNDSNATLTETIAASTGQWYHYAVTRYGSTLTIYRNGVSNGSTTSSASVGVATVITEIGQGNNSYSLNSYIQDLRITKGIARYTQPFTPPTAAFQLL